MQSRLSALTLLEEKFVASVRKSRAIMRRENDHLVIDGIASV
jgi:hypothetical protein